MPHEPLVALFVRNVRSYKTTHADCHDTISEEPLASALEKRGNPPLQVHRHQFKKSFGYPLNCFLNCRIG